MLNNFLRLVEEDHWGYLVLSPLNTVSFMLFRTLRGGGPIYHAVLHIRKPRLEGLSYLLSS